MALGAPDFLQSNASVVYMFYSSTTISTTRKIFAVDIAGDPDYPEGFSEGRSVEVIVN